jgi:folate-binding Fe-S cluster repair protein YgfZ
VTGADRVEFLHGQCSNDIKRLWTGERCYAAFLNAKGKMRGDGHVICLADACLPEMNPGLTPSLEKFIVAEDVTIEDVSATFSTGSVGREFSSKAGVVCTMSGGDEGTEEKGNMDGSVMRVVDGGNRTCRLWSPSIMRARSLRRF